MKLLTCASYHGTGSSAVTNLIDECDNVHDMGDYEFRFVHDPDGICDLEYNLVIPEESWDQKISDVKEFRVDTFVMGDDWKGKFDFLKDYCEVVYLPRTPEISTTKIKQDISKS